MEEIQEKKLVKPRYCSVPQCDSREYRKLHRFPNDQEMQKKWAIACCIGKPIKKNMAVCGFHFLKSDYIPRWDGKMSRLKKIAIPSQNLPTRPSDKRLTSEQIKKREARAKRASKRLARNDISIPPTNTEIVTIKQENTSPKDSKSNASVESHENTEQANVMVSDVPISIKKEIRVLNIEEIRDAMKPNIICKCKAIKAASAADESDETRAAKILVELNEKVWLLFKNNDITIPMKNVILKLGEEFYFAARRYRRSTFVHHLQNDNQIYCFTGADSVLLSDLVKAVTVYESDNANELNVYDLTVEERILMCLVKIRMNLSFESLAQFFRVTEANCETLFYVTLQGLKNALKSAIYWPTADEVTKSMPDSLDYLKKTVAVTDSIQINTEKSICKTCGYPIFPRFSDEKYKLLIGFAHCGLITYVGKAKLGMSSHEIITDETEISGVLVPNEDAIMSNGFLVEQKCNKVLIHLIKSRKELSFCQSSPFQTKTLKPQAIESALRRFKMFKILQTELPIEMVSYLNDLSVVICGIVNLSNPVFYEIKV